MLICSQKEVYINSVSFKKDIVLHLIWHIERKIISHFFNSYYFFHKRDSYWLISPALQYIWYNLHWPAQPVRNLLYSGASPGPVIGGPGDPVEGPGCLSYPVPLRLVNHTYLCLVSREQLQSQVKMLFKVFIIFAL